MTELSAHAAKATIIRTGPHPRTSRTPRRQGIKITGLTSYDKLTAGIFDEAGIDFLLVGDSAGNTVLGYDTTVPVTIDELIPLTRAVAAPSSARSSSPTCPSGRTRRARTRRCTPPSAS